MKAVKSALLMMAMLPLVVGIAGCGSSGKTQTIKVYAAASLKKPFTELAKSFAVSHPGIKVEFNFGGSPTLVEQVNNGAPADILATASLATMKNATTAVNPHPFVTNVLEIAVPQSNPAHIASLADLARPGVKVAICQQAVPCGAVAATVLDKAHVTIKPATEETDVTSVLTKVSLDEVDAGLVYVTDVKGDSSVRGVEIPAALNSVTTYPIAVLKGSTHQSAAQAFVDYIEGAQGRALFTAEGWGRP